MSNELKPPESRGEKTLHDMIGGNYPLDPSQSRVESLLIELKNAIEQGSGGSDIPTITMDSSTYVCTFTEEQATYMKSGKPFLIRLNDEYWLAMLQEHAVEDQYQGTLFFGGSVFAGMFQFNTTTGYFYIQLSHGAYNPHELYISSVSEYKLQSGSSATDASDRDLSEKFFGFSEVGMPGYYDVKMLIIRADSQGSAAFVAVMKQLQSQAAQTGQAANGYLPFNAGDILRAVRSATEDGRNVALGISVDDDPPAAMVAGLSSVHIQGLYLSCTFRGSIIVDETLGSPAEYHTCDFELHFTPHTAAMSVSPPKTYNQLQYD